MEPRGIPRISQVPTGTERPTPLCLCRLYYNEFDATNILQGSSVQTHKSRHFYWLDYFTLRQRQSDFTLARIFSAVQFAEDAVAEAAAQERRDFEDALRAVADDHQAHRSYANSGCFLHIGMAVSVVGGLSGFVSLRILIELWRPVEFSQLQ